MLIAVVDMLSPTSWIARALVADGGSALLAETDELIGAESYVLSKVANFETGDQCVTCTHTHFFSLSLSLSSLPFF